MTDIRSKDKVKHINRFMEELRDKCRTDIEQGLEISKITVSDMGDRLLINNQRLYRNGFPNWFDTTFDSCTWVRGKGLKIKTEQFLDELEDIYPLDVPGDESTDD